MKNSTRLLILFFQIFIPLFLLAACTSPVEVPANEQISSGTPAQENEATLLILPTVTSVPSLEATPTFILTPSPTSELPTQTPLPSATQELPTWTPFPTLLPEEAIVKVNELLADNASCRLPCWWGITPGETLWTEAYQMLAAFTTITEKEHPQGYKIYYPVSTEMEENAFIVTRDNNIDLIIAGSSTQRFEMIPRLLTENGPPDEILIHTMASMPETNYLPFWVILFYQEQHILAADEFPNHKNGNLLIACPTQKGQDSLMGGPWLYLWSPEEIWTEKRIQDTILGPDRPYQPLRRLEEATTMTIETFYQAFKNANSTACVGTPINLWK